MSVHIGHILEPFVTSFEQCLSRSAEEIAQSVQQLILSSSTGGDNISLWGAFLYQSTTVRMLTEVSRSLPDRHRTNVVKYYGNILDRTVGGLFSIINGINCNTISSLADFSKECREVFGVAERYVRVAGQVSLFKDMPLSVAFMFLCGTVLVNLEEKVKYSEERSEEDFIYRVRNTMDEIFRPKWNAMFRYITALTHREEHAEYSTSMEFMYFRGLNNVIPTTLALDSDAKMKLRDVVAAEVKATGLMAPTTDEACYYVEMNEDALQWYEAAVPLSNGKPLGLVEEAARWIMLMKRMAREGRICTEERDPMSFVAYLEDGQVLVRCPALQEMIIMAYEAMRPICADIISRLRTSSLGVSDALSYLLRNVLVTSIVCGDMEAFRSALAGAWISKQFKSDKIAPYKECAEYNQAKWSIR